MAYMPSLSDINKRFEAYIEHHVRMPSWWKGPKAYRAAREAIVRKNRVASRGVPVPVYLVQANRAIFSAGPGAAYYCLVLFTFDTQRMYDGEYMRNLAATVASMKNTQQPTQDGQYVANLTTDERASLDRRRPLPASMTGGAVVYAADLVLPRVRLANGYLQRENDLLCLAEPDPVDAAAPLPALELVPWWIAAGLPEQVPGYPLLDLQPGEVLLYDRRPNPALYARRRSAIYVIVGVTFAALLSSGFWASQLLVGLVPVGVILVLFGVIARSRYRVEMTNARATRYVVTNWRIALQYVEVLTGTERARVGKVEIPLSTIKPALRLSARGNGTVKLGVGKYAISDVPDAKAVYDMLIEALSGEAAKGPEGAVDPEMAEWSRTSGVLLRVGEQIQWYGMPHAATYLRSESTRAIAACTVVSIVLGYALSVTSGWQLVAEVLGGALALTSAGILWGAWYRAKHLDYYVTNQRVIIRKSTFGSVRVTDRELRETIGMKILPRGNGIGTLVLDKHSKFRFHGHFATYSVDEFTFHAIPNPQDVAGLIVSLRA